jgi:hypothetical protein
MGRRKSLNRGAKAARVVISLKSFHDYEYHATNEKLPGLKPLSPQT